MQVSLLPEQHSILRGFLKHSDFMSGAVILDLDGTALYENHGKVFISGSVEQGVRDISEIGRPVIINTLRFPLSVACKIANEWLRYVPEMSAILLNGSLTGTFKSDPKNSGQVIFEEHMAKPIEGEKIIEIVKGIGELVENGIHDIDLFYYPRDWKAGEIIWVPDASRVPFIQAKYKSASRVHDGTVHKLEADLLKEDICMIMLLIDRPKDELMAYQHQEPSDFFTRKGVSKSYALREYARLHNIALLDSIGGGDTPMDNFLSDTGLALIVGEGNHCPYRGRKESMWLKDPVELGELLSSVARIVRGEPL